MSGDWCASKPGCTFVVQIFSDCWSKTSRRTASLPLLMGLNSRRGLLPSGGPLGLKTCWMCDDIRAAIWASNQRWTESEISCCVLEKEKKRGSFLQHLLLFLIRVDNRQHLYASVNSQMLCPYLNVLKNRLKQECPNFFALRAKI